MTISFLSGDEVRQVTKRQIGSAFGVQEEEWGENGSRLYSNVCEELEAYGKPLTEEDVRGFVSYVLGRLRPCQLTQLELCISLGCNLSCSYCFVHDKLQNAVLDDKRIVKAIDFLFRKARPNDNLNVSFMGGEPLLQARKMAMAIARAKERAEEAKCKVSFSATTNATLITRETMALLGRDVKFLVSLDGDKETTDRHRGEGVYERVVRGIRVLRTTQPWMGVRMTVHHDTVHRMYENFLHAVGLGFNQFLIGSTFVDPGGWSDEKRETYKQEYVKVCAYYLEHKGEKSLRISSIEDAGIEQRHWGCRAANSCISVSPLGDVYPCCKFFEFDDYILGTVDTLDDDWRKNIHVSRYLFNSDLYRSKCRECEYKSHCTGGCPAENAWKCGDPTIPPPEVCHITRVSQELNAEFIRMKSASQGEASA